MTGKFLGSVSLLFVVTLSMTAIAVADDEADGWEIELDKAHQALEQAAEQIAELTRGMSERVLGSIDIEIGKRAMLGVNIGPGGGTDEDGVEILAVSPGGPAERAGLKRGDRLLKIDDRTLAGSDDLSAQRHLLDYLATVEPGSEVALQYKRGSDTRNVTVTTITQPMVPPLYIGFGRNKHHHSPHDFAIAVPPMHINALRRWGNMELVELTPGLGVYFGTDQGILVVRTHEDNPFGLRDGDVIQKIGDRSPRDPQHAMRILHSYAGGETIEMSIQRKKRPMELTAEVPDQHSMGSRFASPVHEFSRNKHDT